MKILINVKNLTEDPDIVFYDEMPTSKSGSKFFLNNKMNLSIKNFTDKTAEGIFLRLIGCQVRVSDLEKDEFYSNILKKVKLTHVLNKQKNILQNLIYHKKKITDDPSVLVGVIEGSWKNTENEIHKFLAKFIENVKKDINTLLLSYSTIDTFDVTYDEDYFLNLITKVDDYFNFDKNSITETMNKFILKYNDLADELTKKEQALINDLTKKEQINFEKTSKDYKKLMGLFITYAVRLFYYNNNGYERKYILNNQNETGLKGIAPSSGNITFKDIFKTSGKNGFKTSAPMTVAQSDGFLEIEVNSEDEETLKVVKELVELYNIKHVPVGHGMGEVENVYL